MRYRRSRRGARCGRGGHQLLLVNMDGGSSVRIIGRIRLRRRLGGRRDDGDIVCVEDGTPTDDSESYSDEGKAARGGHWYFFLFRAVLVLVMRLKGLSTENRRRLLDTVTNPIIQIIIEKL